MPFTLDVATDPAAHRATLRLSDGDGRHLAAHELALDKPSALWTALLDARGHVRRMRRSATPGEHLAELGAFLGTHVLGPGILGHLAREATPRTLLVRLPPAEGDRLAADFARVPWELAVARAGDRTLGDRDLAVRVAFAGEAPGEATLAPADGEALRVLLVFAEAPHARPLAARLERERLRELFFAEVLPGRDVEVDVLCHGVTRTRIEEQVRARAGYHLVHWSGHGDVGRLQVAGEDGGVAWISGEALVALFEEAGGFIPWAAFLNACHSGAPAQVTDWASLREAEEAGGEREGLTGTALSLLRAGVRQVVAMRWEVGDTYARRLARRFYRHLLADEAQHGVDTALSLARGELARDKVRAGEYDAVDHATPVVFGREGVRASAVRRRSKQMDRRAPRPQPLLTGGSRELDPPWGFVGRGEELASLLGAWMERGAAPVAVIQGLAGLGKTSLAAEVVNLGYERFDYVLAFQGKGAPLGIEDMYQRIDQRLAQASPAYRARCQENDRAKVFLASGPGFQGPERYEMLAYNVVDAMGAERILIVLDNFETNLVLEQGEYACADPAWTRLFEVLCERLQITGSRVLVTTRHKPAVLEERALWLPIGPLPIEEARLYFENHAVLRELWYGKDRVLAQLILDVSRGHPLILARIADLAKLHYDRKSGLTTPGRAALEEALTRIQGDGYKTLPSIFTRPKNREQEHKYLHDVAVGAVDLLIDRLPPETRRLLWVVTGAGEPVPEALVAEVWSEPTMLLGVLCGTGLLTRDKDKAYAFHELVSERAAVWVQEHPDDRGERNEADIWTAYGAWYGAAYHTRIASRKPGSRDAAAEMGRLGIRYLVRARAFESLTSFASHRGRAKLTSRFCSA